jgi:hypothetical protein
VTGVEAPPSPHGGASVTGVPSPAGPSSPLDPGAGDTTCLIIIPRLGRPHNVQPLLDSVEAATPEPHRVVFVISEPDDHYEGVDELWCDERTWAHKINHAYRNSTEPFLFCGADDLRFHPGWLSECLAAVAAGFDVVGTDDMGNRTGVVTHPFVTRRYADLYGTVDGPGAVVCDEYPHQFVDNEFTITAAAREALTYRPGARVEHLHPFWSKGEWDPVYEEGHGRWAESEAVFKRRLPHIEAMLRREGRPVTLH